MTKHKHAEMIKAKTDNMDLVVFVKAAAYGGEWFKIDQHDLPTNPHQEYFLCHPKHDKECLHWLNGGEVQSLGSAYFYPFRDTKEWRVNHCMLNPSETFRIKSRKEKRWIGIYRGEFVTEKTMSTPQDAREYVSSSPHYKYCAPEGWQFIEIEVEA